MATKPHTLKALAERKRAQEKKANARFYNMNSILGNDWAMFYVIIGGRMTGKSYALTDFLCRQKKQHGDMCKNYWMRISESSTKAMLANKADKLIDPDLKRKYDVDLTTKDCEVFDHGKPFMTGELPIGVHYDTQRQKFVASYRRGMTHKFIGRYNTPSEAFKAYKIAKEQYIKELAEKYFQEGKITRKVYDALMKYEVDITD